MAFPLFKGGKPRQQRGDFACFHNSDRIPIPIGLSEFPGPVFPLNFYPLLPI